MLRLVARMGLLFSVILLGLVATLAYVRRDEPQTVWIVFTVKQTNGFGFDIYRVLSDGTHTKQIASTHDQNPSLGWQPPSWITLEDRYRGYKRLQLVHILGYPRTVMAGNYGWASLLNYDTHTAYVRFSDERHDYAPTLAAIDVRTGERRPFELPLKLENVRASFGDGGYIVWSDYQSKGDLYGISFANPPRVQRLTTRGDVLPDFAPISHPGWLYFFVTDGNLYRIREDGSGEQLVAERVLNPQGALYFGQSQADSIYYWAGDAANPHLVQARPDGTQPLDLPIPVVRGWVQGWSPDRIWVYYSESPPIFNAPATGANLRRLNLQTGENQEVWAAPNVQNMVWSADGQWLILAIEADTHYIEFHRMRPDGTADIVLAAGVRSHTLFQNPQGPLVVFSTWDRAGSQLQLLDLRTFEIAPLDDGAPPSPMRFVHAMLPLPDRTWSLGWLMGIGIIGLGAGIIALWKDGRDVNKTPV